VKFPTEIGAPCGMAPTREGLAGIPHWEEKLTFPKNPKTASEDNEEFK
jgi:hypothetical protein